MHSVVFGDNHLFGINHLSVEKAQEYDDQFSTDDAVRSTFLMLKRNQVSEQMLSAHKRAKIVCQIALKCHPDLIVHPVIPYAHAINDEAAAKGVIRAGLDMVRPNFIDAAKLVLTLLSPRHDVQFQRSSVARFIQTQLELFGNIPANNRGTLFLNNVFTDLLVGLGMEEWFSHFSLLCKEQGFQAGIITYNPRFFLERELEGVSLCIQHNHIGYLNNISDAALKELSRRYSVWAMGIFGSGAYCEGDVLDDLKKRDFDKVVFASSKEERLRSFLSAIRNVDP